MLNAIKLKPSYSNKAVLVLIMLYLFVALCCGKRKPPLPPVERVPQKVEIDAKQRGDVVFISWTMPARNASDSSILNIDRVDIYRYAEPANSSLSLTEEEFAARSTIIKTIKVTDNDFGLKKQTYNDNLEFANQPIRLIYAIRLVNAVGQKASFSNFLVIEPSAKVAGAAENVAVEITEPAIIVKWNPPAANVDNSTPVNILGYNIYRKENEAEAFKLLNTSVEAANSYSDKSFEFGKKYQYFVRTVSLGNDGEKVESLDSKIIEVSPVDVFAPTAPDAVTIAAAPGNLSLFFAANPEKDIAGYKIYRSTDQNIPISDWTLLTPEILKTNTFQDKQVERGKTYYYYLTALDNAGNISSPSGIVSEIAP